MQKAFFLVVVAIATLFLPACGGGKVSDGGGSSAAVLQSDCSISTRFEQPVGNSRQPADMVSIREFGLLTEHSLRSFSQDKGAERTWNSLVGVVSNVLGTVNASSRSEQGSQLCGALAQMFHWKYEYDATTRVKQEGKAYLVFNFETSGFARNPGALPADGDQMPTPAKATLVLLEYEEQSTGTASALSAVMKREYPLEMTCEVPFETRLGFEMLNSNHASLDAEMCKYLDSVQTNGQTVQRYDCPVYEAVLTADRCTLKGNAIAVKDSSGKDRLLDFQGTLHRTSSSTPDKAFYRLEIDKSGFR